MFRIVFLTFGGQYRGDAKPHESSRIMIIPMAVLAVLAVGSGWVNATGGFDQFLGHSEGHSFAQGFLGALSHPLAWVSQVLAAVGIFLAYAVYSARWLSAEGIRRRFFPVYKLLSSKYWVDEVYENIVVKAILLNRLFAGLKFFDSRGVDGAVNGIADTVVIAGQTSRKVQAGQLQLYGVFMVLGVLAIILAMYLTG
jgi:NADH-quinone oxidoreductase subunit L